MSVTPTDGRGTRQLGRGFDLTTVDDAGVGRDLVWRGTDLALVGGEANLGNALQVRLLTPRGGDLMNLRFGFDGLRVLSMDLSHAMVTRFLDLALRQALSADGRIAEVLEVRVDPVPDASRTWTLAATVRTRGGETLALELGEVDGDG